MARCTLCNKSKTSGSAVSHSQIHTKRTFGPNLQKVNGLLLCTRCLKTINKQKKIEAERMQEKLELKAPAKESTKISAKSVEKKETKPKSDKK